MNNFDVLIIGTDINAYTMARNYHELYGKKANIIGKEEMKFTSCSSITNIIYEPDLWDGDVFRETLKKYAERQKKDKILLIGTNDFYVRLIVENKEYLEKWYVFNYPNLQIIDQFMKKNLFYETYKEQLDLPKTFIYSCKEKKLELDLQFPVVVKPGDGVSYYKHKFEGQNKVFRAADLSELKQIIKKIEDSGYKENLVIQEFIPGGDAALFDCMFYCNSKGKAEIATFAQIGLQEHTPTGVGNCTVLVNGYSEYGIDETVIYKLKNFLETVGYTGWAEVDLKYDNRDQKYKVLEINTRQARCSYYVTACGYNLVEALIDDLLLHKDKKFCFVTEKRVLSFVPKNILYKKVRSKPLLNQVKELVKEKKFYSPLHYEGDTCFKRRVYLFLRGLNYRKKYKRENWWML